MDTLGNNNEEHERSQPVNETVNENQANQNDDAPADGAPAPWANDMWEDIPLSTRCNFQEYGRKVTGLVASQMKELAKSRRLDDAVKMVQNGQLW